MSSRRGSGPRRGGVTSALNGPCTCSRPDGSLAAILPLYEAATRPLRIARLVGHGLADQLGPVSEPAERAGVAAALAGLVSDDSARWDLLLVERLPARDGWGSLGDAALPQARGEPGVETAGRAGTSS